MKTYIVVFLGLILSTASWANNTPSVSQLLQGRNQYNTTGFSYYFQNLSRLDRRGEGITVAVIDTGINIWNSDISSNLAYNYAENDFPKRPGIDDDKNGKVDDFLGWNFKDNSQIVYDEAGHGTHVAGIIAGQSLGIAPRAKILPLKINETPELISVPHLLEAIHYAGQRGAKIVNLSLSAGLPLPVTKILLESVLDEASRNDILVVVAAGNGSLDITDIPYYPAVYDAPNLLTVCSVGPSGLLSSFSNYSATKVHLCAPGENILSTNTKSLDTNQEPFFVSMSGTSMATPVVSGIAAVVWSNYPSLKAAQLKKILIDTARENSRPWLLGKSVSGGIVDLPRALVRASQI